jgi:hypothetical protein
MIRYFFYFDYLRFHNLVPHYHIHFWHNLFLCYASLFHYLTHFLLLVFENNIHFSQVEHFQKKVNLYLILLINYLQI